jgi:hypothetical protein
MKEIEVGCGDHVARACERLVKEAPAFMVFNDVRVEARPGDSAADLHGRWTAEMDRKRREYEASPECKRHQEEGAKRAVEEKRVRDEALRTIAASGVREKYPWTPEMGEISGFGGGYENACRDMVYAGLAWLATRPSADLSSSKTDDAKALERVILAAVPDCSGAMHGATMNAIAFIAKHGWDKYREAMTKRTASHTGRDGE